MKFVFISFSSATRVPATPAVCQPIGADPPPVSANQAFRRILELGAALALTFLAAPVVHAQVAIQGTAVPCAYCTDAQMREAVVWRGPGTHYVSDIPGSVLRRYTVSCGTGGQTQGGGDATAADVPSTSDVSSATSSSADAFTQSFCTGPASVIPATVEQPALDQFYLVRQLWIDTGGTFTKSMDFPYVNTGLFWNPPPGPLGGPNAYNVVGDVNFRGMLGTALANNTQVVGFDYARTVATWVGAMINAFAGQTDGLRIVIRVVFPDGSSVTYDYQYGDTSATYRSNSARTPVGQVIPDPEVANSPSGAGYWSELGPYGGHEDLERFLEYMRMRGVRIVRGEGTRIRSVRCDWDGQTLTCSTT